jgi:hypothetical protein
MEGHLVLTKQLDFEHFMVPGFENPMEGHLVLTKRLEFDPFYGSRV